MKIKITKIREHNIKVGYDGKAFNLWDNLFRIYEYEETPEKLMSEYIKGLESLIEFYCIADDSQLTSDAIEFKKKLNSYVKYEIIG